MATINKSIQILELLLEKFPEFTYLNYNADPINQDNLVSGSSFYICHKKKLWLEQRRIFADLMILDSVEFKIYGKDNIPVVDKMCDLIDDLGIMGECDASLVALKETSHILNVW